MTEQEIEAKRLYNDCPTVKPNWDQLGDVTRSYWMEKAAKSLAAKEKHDDR